MIVPNFGLASLEQSKQKLISLHFFISFNFLFVTLDIV